MSEYETVNYSVDAGAATIELNRPDNLNAWNYQFGLDLLAAVERARDDEAVRAVLITGAGRGFSSGADLREVREEDAGADGRPDLSKRLRERYHPILIGIREMPKPVVAAVNGPAVGIGCSLALDCDLILAAESSYFLLAFVNIGLIPDGGSTALVPARIGHARAAEMTLLGEKIPAREGARVGADQPGRRRRRAPSRGRGAHRAAGEGPDRRLREREEAPQPPPLRRLRGPARGGGRGATGAGTERRLRRGRDGLHAEARAGIHR